MTNHIAKSKFTVKNSQKLCKTFNVNGLFQNIYQMQKLAS